MKKIFVLFVLFYSTRLISQDINNIVPTPVKINYQAEYIVISKATTILARESKEKNAAILLNNFLEKEWNRLNITSTKNLTGTFIELIIKKNNKNPEGYTLTIHERGVTIEGNDEAGLFYGIQTFFQFIPSFKNAPAVANGIGIRLQKQSITDYPRFPYRGMHFDVARHFSSVENVKKYIDYLAMHKFNRFHWHLTDDQGWRIEIKKYPLLTQIGSCRAQTLVGPYGTNKYDGKKYCGFYTQEQIKEVVQYAAERHIIVIPEIEMPGHALAALASYNYLGCTKGPYKAAETWGVFDDVFCAGNDSTFTFLQNVLDEVLTLFPSKLIHIGGDESPKTRWKTCPDCQRRIKNEKLKDEHELQSYFITRIEKYLNSKGRNIIGWDEILEGGLAPNAAVMSWRGEEGGITAAKQHHNVVMTPGNYLYFDHSQSNNEDSITFGGYNSLEKVYSYEPIPAALSAEESKYILGAQANLWTEYITNPKKVEYQLFPRIAALSEVLWSPKEKRNWEDFKRRLPGIFERYKAQKINYSNAFYDLSPQVKPTADYNGVLWQIDLKKITGKQQLVVKGYGNPDTMVDVPYYNNIGDVTGTTTLHSAEKILLNIDSTGNILIKDSATVYALLMENKSTDNIDPAEHTKTIIKQTSQQFFFNIATGKKISLINKPSETYSGCGGFTLVDGVHNKTGMSKSSQFLGFAGDDLDATIDLGTNQLINNITLRVFEQTASWIYRPQFVCFYISENGKDFQLLGTSINNDMERHLLYKFEKPVTARYVRIHAKNAGIIKDGEPGAGKKAWLFVDEIEVN